MIQIRTAFVAKPISGPVSRYPANRYQHPKQGKVRKIPAHATFDQAVDQHSAIHTCDKKQTVARQKEADHQPRFRKNDKQQHPKPTVLDIKFWVDKVPKMDRYKFQHKFLLILY